MINEEIYIYDLHHAHAYIQQLPPKGVPFTSPPTVPNTATTFPSGWLWTAFTGGTPWLFLVLSSSDPPIINCYNIIYIKQNAMDTTVLCISECTQYSVQ